MLSRKAKDNIVKGLIYFSAGFTILILAIIIGFIVIKGLPGISVDFLTNNYEDNTTYVYSTLLDEKKQSSNDAPNYVNNLGITIDFDEEYGVVITEIDKKSPLKEAIDGNNQVYKVKKDDAITKVESYNIEKSFSFLFIIYIYII